MKTTRWFRPVTVPALIALCLGNAAAADASAPVTFDKDVLPILQKHCQTCHRPGEAPPMALTLVWFMPHMHLRGKDMTYRLTYPDGRSEIVLSVPRYDFEWQLGYYVEKPITVPKGTTLHVTAHYDNSAGNKFNPNPNRPVWWGDQTWEEMMVPWFGVIVSSEIDPTKVMAYTSEAR